MKKLALIPLMAMFASQAAAEDVNRTIDADRDGDIHISNVAGSIAVEGWDRDAVRVTGTLGRNVDELIFERSGDSVKIKVKLPKRGGRGGDANLTISVPHRSSLDIGTVSASIDVQDVHGEQSLHSVSGNIDTEFSGEDVDAEAVSGTVEIRGDGSDGDVDAGSVSGNVKIYGVSGDVTAEVVSGNVLVEGSSIEDAELSTVNGTLKFRGELRRNGDFNAETVNGAVNVKFQSDLSAEIMIDSLNGAIRNCFGPEPRRTSKYGPGKELNFVHGDGDGDIEISTVNGSITLCKE